MSATIPFETLLDRARTGELDDADTRRLAIAIRNDPEAALEQQLFTAFDEEREPASGDDALLERLLAGVNARLEPEPEVARSAEPEPEVARLDPEPEVARLSTPAARSMEALPSGAASLDTERRARFSFAQSTTRRFAVAVGAVPSRWRLAAAAAVVFAGGTFGGWAIRGAVQEPTLGAVATDAPAVEEEAEPTDREVEQDEQRRRRTRHGAAALLSRAEQALSAGRYERAAGLYRAVLRRHPRSAEAEAARMGLARVLLDHLDAPEDALEEFDDYIDQHRDGLLLQEAEVGRAQALERMGGDTGERRRAWQHVREAYPDSPAADLAERALGGRR